LRERTKLSIFFIASAILAIFLAYISGRVIANEVSVGPDWGGGFFSPQE
jgi:hypothetical protein